MSLPSDNLAGAGAGADTSQNTNGIAHTDPQNAPLETISFGIFNEQVGHGVQHLRDGWSTVDSAVTELTRAFDEHQRIVTVVGQRHGKDAVLEREIQKLKIQKDGIWDHILKDRENYERRESETRHQHEAEVTALQRQAEAGAQEKKQYEKLQRQLTIQHKNEREEMERDFQQQRARVERETAATVAALEKQKKDLETAGTELRHALNERTTERDQERTTREAQEVEARALIRSLERSLHEINMPYQMDHRPSHF